MKIVIRILINTLIGLALIFLWYQFTDTSQVLSNLQQIQPVYIIGFFFFFLLTIILRGLRLKYLLNRKDVTYSVIIPLSFVGQFLSFFIPIRAGEIAKGFYFTGEYGIPLPKTLTWIFIDRFLDFWANLGLMALFLYFVSINLPSNFHTIVTILFAVATIAAVIAVKSRKLAEILVDKLSPLLLLKPLITAFRSFSKNILEGFAVLDRSPKDILILLLLTIGSSLSDTLIYYFILSSLGISMEIVKLWVGTLLTALTYLIPAAPGFVGSAEASGLAVYGYALGLPHDAASTIAVLNHVLLIVAILITGIISIYLLKFDLKLFIKNLFGKK